MATCVFNIPENSENGGKLTGGFTSNATLAAGDNLTITVIHPDAGAAPATLTGICVFSTSPLAQNQTTPTPFTNFANGNFRCITSSGASGSIVNDQMVYNFGSIPYAGGFPGSYELTFIAVDSSGSTPVQWSEDPEFDTSN